jgi:hypothetical protein
MRRRVGHALLAWEILTIYIRVRICLRRQTLPETVAVLRGGIEDDGPASAAAISLGRHLASATVRTITPLPGDSRCLMRSLVLMRALARRGVGSTLVLSAAPGPPLQAHAWIEHAGRPLLPPARYEQRPLARL